VRWKPNKSAYAIELKLALVPRLIRQVADAEKLGMEIGGVLLGALVKVPVPTLRIEEFEHVPRNLEDGPVYMLDPAQQQHLASLWKGASARGMTGVGFFRSHLRPGPLRPSLADRSLLVGHSRDSVYTILLIEAREPRMGAFFLARNGHLSMDPAVQEFRFGERALKSVREIRSSLAVEKYNVPQKQQPSAPPVGLSVRQYAAIAFLLLITLISGIFSWPVLSRFLSSWGNLDLAVTGSTRVLRISWNHDLPEIARAGDASLSVSDGTARRVVQLDKDELRLGAVEYERQSRPVQVILTINLPGSTSVRQSVEWAGK